MKLLVIDLVILMIWMQILSWQLLLLLICIHLWLNLY